MIHLYEIQRRDKARQKVDQWLPEATGGREWEMTNNGYGVSLGMM